MGVSESKLEDEKTIDAKHRPLVVLVTGGTGLVGKAIETVVNEDPTIRAEFKTWVFASSRDADLRYKRFQFNLKLNLLVTVHIIKSEINNQQWLYFTNTDQHTSSIWQRWLGDSLKI
jgi:aspartate-semialdehyde dehydrogenase